MCCNKKTRLPLETPAQPHLLNCRGPHTHKEEVQSAPCSEHGVQCKRLMHVHDTLNFLYRAAGVCHVLIDGLLLLGFPYLSESHYHSIS